jgi:hypothetical protein
MANKNGENAAGGLEPGEDYQDLERQVDRGQSAKSTGEGEKLASKLGISVEELDRRMHLEDARRDAAGLPPLANTAIRERANLDDFGSEPDVASAGSRDPRHATKADGKGGALNAIDEGEPQPDESAAVKTAREERQREAAAALDKRLHHAGNSYYHKDDSARVAFMDRGGQLVTQEKDPATASAMALAAEAKGWTTIKVSGSEQFKREVWLEASLRGIEVKGFQPKEADVAALAIKREQKARNILEAVTVTNRARDQPTQAEIAKDAKSKQQAEDYNLRRPDARSGVDKAKVIEAVAAAVVGTKITSPVVRAKVMTEVTRQLEKQDAKGKQPPTVQTYDKNAPPKARDAERARPQVDRNSERTR